MQKRILFIGHDANFAGAQYLLLHFLRFLKKNKNIETLLILGNGGGLLEEFKETTKVIFWENDNKIDNGYITKIAKSSKIPNFLKKNSTKDKIFTEIENFNPEIVFSNTIANGTILQKLDYLKKPFFVYCHEMEKSIKTYTKADDLKYQLNNAKYILTGSKAVKENLHNNYQIVEERIGVFPSYIDCQAMENDYQGVDKQAIKAKLSISNNAIIVGGCGLIEWRKGIDIFIYTALQVINSTQNEVHFVWVGINKKSEEYYHLMYDLQRMGIADKVHLIEGSENIIDYTACFDLFFMSSREDPYPLVMIEAGLNKIPVVCFDKSGGAVDFVGDLDELKIPYLDIEKATNKITELIDNQLKRQKLGEIFYKKALYHDISVRGPQILEKIFNIN